MKKYQVVSGWILTLASTTHLALGAQVTSAAEPSVQSAESASDLALANRVFSRFRSDDTLRYHTANVEVSARSGLVTLWGSVRRDAIRGRMEQVARSVKGAGRVVNLLVVDPKKGR